MMWHGNGQVIHVNKNRTEVMISDCYVIKCDRNFRNMHFHNEQDNKRNSIPSMFTRTKIKQDIIQAYKRRRINFKAKVFSP